MESDGAGPAEPKRTLGSALGRVLPESIVLTSCLETTGGHLVIVGRLSRGTYPRGALKTLNLLPRQQLLIYSFSKGRDNEPIEQPE